MFVGAAGRGLRVPAKCTCISRCIKLLGGKCVFLFLGWIYKVEDSECPILLVGGDKEERAPYH